MTANDDDYKLHCGGMNKFGNDMDGGRVLKWRPIFEGY